MEKRPSIVREIPYRYAVTIALILIVAGNIVMRLNLLPMPLERDEGEYAYAGQLILRGIPPYAGIYNMKLPGMYYIYAGILRLLGESVTAIHAALAGVTSVSALLVFILTRRLFHNLTALAAAAFFAILSVNPFVHGLFAHAEHFVLPFVLACLSLILSSGGDKGRLEIFAGGLALGMAVIIKQHAYTFAGMALCMLLLDPLAAKGKGLSRTAKDIFLFILAISLPLVATCLFFYALGLWENFSFLVFTYAREYVGMVNPTSALPELYRNSMAIFGYGGPVLLLAFLGAVMLFMHGEPLKKRLFVGLFGLFSFLAVTPGFYFREHYFILLLPATALLAAFSLRRLFLALPNTKMIRRSVFVVFLFVLATGLSLCLLFPYLFQTDPRGAIRLTHTLNPFPESLPVARYIKENSHPSDTIAVLGSEPQIYFYSQRRSATGFIYMYPLMEPHPYALAMQTKMIHEIESARPKYLVFVNIPTSWLKRHHSRDQVITWFERYSARHYQRCALVEIHGDGKTNYFWGDEAARRESASPLWLSIHRRDH